MFSEQRMSRESVSSAGVKSVSTNPAPSISRRFSLMNISLPSTSEMSSTASVNVLPRPVTLITFSSAAFTSSPLPPPELNSSALTIYSPS